MRRATGGPQHLHHHRIHLLAMFSSAAGRVVSTLPPPAVCAFARPAALSAAQKPFARPGHQRRLSSSKASTPPADGSDANGSASAQQTPAGAEKTPAEKAPARKAKGRAGRKTATAPPVPALNVPHVPPTDYLQKPGMQAERIRIVLLLISFAQRSR